MGLVNSGSLFDYPIATPLSPGPNPAVGQIMSGCSLVFYLSTTTTPLPVYGDGALNTSLGNVVTANASGQFPPIYLDPQFVYRVQLYSLPNGGGIKLQDIDPYVVPVVLSNRIVTSTKAGFFLNSVAPFAIVFTFLPVGIYQIDALVYFGAISSGAQGIKFTDGGGSAGVTGFIPGVGIATVPAASGSPIIQQFGSGIPLSIATIDVNPFGTGPDSAIFRYGIQVTNPGTYGFQAAFNSAVAGAQSWITGSVIFNRVG